MQSRKALMINKRTDYVEALSLSHPPPPSEGKEELRRRCLIGIERSKTTHLFPRIAYPSRGSVICFPFAPPLLSDLSLTCSLSLSLSRTIAVDTRRMRRFRNLFPFRSSSPLRPLSLLLSVSVSLAHDCSGYETHAKVP
jgi:hypothetical protein